MPGQSGWATLRNRLTQDPDWDKRDFQKAQKILTEHRKQLPDTVQSALQLRKFRSGREKVMGQPEVQAAVRTLLKTCCRRTELLPDTIGTSVSFAQQQRLSSQIRGLQQNIARLQEATGSQPDKPGSMPWKKELDALITQLNELGTTLGNMRIGNSSGTTEESDQKTMEGACGVTTMGLSEATEAKETEIAGIKTKIARLQKRKVVVSCGKLLVNIIKLTIGLTATLPMSDASKILYTASRIFMLPDTGLQLVESCYQTYQIFTVGQCPAPPIVLKFELYVKYSGENFMGYYKIPGGSAAAQMMDSIVKLIHNKPKDGTSVSYENMACQLRQVVVNELLTGIRDGLYPLISTKTGDIPRIRQELAQATREKNGRDITREKKKDMFLAIAMSSIQLTNLFLEIFKYYNPLQLWSQGQEHGTTAAWYNATTHANLNDTTTASSVADSGGSWRVTTGITLNAITFAMQCLLLVSIARKTALQRQIGATEEKYGTDQYTLSFEVDNMNPQEYFGNDQAPLIRATDESDSEEEEEGYEEEEQNGVTVDSDNNLTEGMVTTSVTNALTYCAITF